MAQSKWPEVKEKLILVEGWARDGLTDEQIAKNLGISKDTFYQYKKQHPDFSETLKRGKEVVDREVENALFQRAMGYEYEEDTVITNPDGSQVIKTVTKKMAPDVTAQIFWLKNRKPAEWRDKREIEATGKDGEPFQITIKRVKPDGN